MRVHLLGKILAKDKTIAFEIGWEAHCNATVVEVWYNYF